jgi:hypothetical protein
MAALVHYPKTLEHIWNPHLGVLEMKDTGSPHPSPRCRPSSVQEEAEEHNEAQTENCNSGCSAMTNKQWIQWEAHNL